MNFLSGFIIGCLVTAPLAQDPTIIKGKLEGLDNGWVYLSYNDGTEWKSDSTKVKGGSFMFRLLNQEANMYYLRGADRKKGSASFFAEGGTTILIGKADEMGKLTASGTKAQTEFLAFCDALKPYDEKLSAVLTEYRKIDDKTPNAAMLRDSIDKVYDELGKPRLVAIKDFAIKNPTSVIGPWAVKSNFYYPEANELDPVYNALTPAVQNSMHGKRLKEAVDLAKITGVGAMAPDFSMSDSTGKVVSLSSFKGQVVLLDFWASWCGPCRRENPNIVKAYEKYHDKGFTVFGVSADTKKEKWVKAVKDDKLTWTHVSDLKGWSNTALKQYGINALPSNLLIDKEGKIVAKNLHGEEYEKKLAELLK